VEIFFCDELRLVKGREKEGETLIQSKQEDSERHFADLLSLES